MRHYGVFALSTPVFGIVRNELSRFGIWILANGLCALYSVRINQTPSQALSSNYAAGN
jgi:hypothetical protein